MYSNTDTTYRKHIKLATFMNKGIIKRISQNNLGDKIAKIDQLKEGVKIKKPDHKGGFLKEF